MNTERTVPRDDAERRTRDLQHATRLRKTLKDAPGHAITMTGRELRSWFARGKLTDKARRDIDAAISTASLIVEPPLSSVDDLDAHHRLSHPLAESDRQADVAPASSSPGRIFERPSRSRAGHARSGQTRSTPESAPRFERSGAATPAPVPTGAPAPRFTRQGANGTDDAPTPSSGRSKAKWIGWGVAALLGVGWISSLGSDDTTSTPAARADRSTAAEAPPTAAPTAPSAVDEAAAERASLVSDARVAAAGGRYAEAYRLAVRAKRGDLVKTYQAKGLSRARTRAEAAVRRGAPQDALSIVRTTRSGYGSPGALAAVAGEARSDVAERQRERAAAKQRAKAAAAAAKQARADERAREKAAAALAASEAESAATSSGGSDYAGMTCPEIGHSFTVEPGSDPEHDRDNDGLACESQ